MAPEDLAPKAFPLGALLVTPGAMRTHGPEAIVRAIGRHACKDWGDLDPEDRATNARALRGGARLLSAYTLPAGKLWVITEADRSATTALLPEEY